MQSPLPSEAMTAAPRGLASALRWPAPLRPTRGPPARAQLRALLQQASSRVARRRPCLPLLASALGWLAGWVVRWTLDLLLPLSLLAGLLAGLSLLAGLPAGLPSPLVGLLAGLLSLVSALQMMSQERQHRRPGLAARRRVR